MKNNQITKYLLIALVAIAFYGSSLKYGFSQDDFFHLSIARADSIIEFVQFFIPNIHDWVFFRPISTQVFYFIFSTLFGWYNSPLPMHIFMIILHFTNSILIMHIINKLPKKLSPAGLPIAIIYAASPIHFLSLFYIGAVQQLLTTFFSLITIFAFINRKNNIQALSFILALLSKEIAIRLPPLVTLYAIIRGDTIKSALSKTKNLYFISALYFAFRYLGGFSIPSEYSISLNPVKIAASSMWYGLFSLGAPEQLLRYGLSKGAINYTQFMFDHSPFAITLLLSALLLLLLVVVAIYKSTKNKAADAKPSHLFLWWIIGIAPVLPFIDHKYPHYLDLSLIAILIFLFTAYKKKTTRIIITSLFLLTSLSGLTIEKDTHWTIGRSKIVAKSFQVFEDNKLCQADSLLLSGENNVAQEVSYALMLEHGPQIFCNNQDMHIYYSGVNYTDQKVDKTIYLTKDILQ